MVEEKVEDEIDVLDYFIVLAKRKKLIIAITLSITIITAVISLIMPPIYRAETRVLPPQQSDSGIATQLLGRFGGAAGLAGSALGIKNPSELYVGMIKSRTIYDRIIDRFGLMDIYDAEYREDARERLKDSVNVELDKTSSILVISVEDKDPGKAADMANAFVEELKKLLQNIAVTEASLRRLFFEKQLEQIKDTLIKSEEAMKEFQERTGILEVEQQAGAVIESIANLRAHIAAKEVELKVMRTYSTPNNPDLQKVAETLKGLKIELAKLETKGGSNPDPLMPTGRMPAVGTDYIRKLRDMKYNEKLFELIAGQYEIARVDEARDAAIIQAIDKAVPPEKKFKPKRTLMVIIAAFVSFFLSVFVAFFMEYIEKQSEGGKERSKVATLKKHLSFKKNK